MARHDVARAVREAIAGSGTLYRWAAGQPGREIFHGRGETFGVALGPTRAVVRHARRGGLVARVLDDWYAGPPRFLRELGVSRHLAEAGVPTPAVLAGVAYLAGIGCRADVATARLDGQDLATLCSGLAAPEGEARAAVFRAVGRLVRRLHDAGYVHPDLQLRNVLVARSGAGPTAYLLDVDTCRRLARGREVARALNLGRFFRSWTKWNRPGGARLTEADREAFELGYREGGAA